MKKTLITLALVGLSAVATYAQGTVQFANSALASSKVKYQESPGAAIVDAPVGMVIGLFWGEDAAGSAAITGQGKGTLSLPTTTIVNPGVFAGGTAYQVPGTAPQQRVWLKIAGWDASAGNNAGGSAHYGESAAISAVLGPATGPGTVVWQGSSGTATDRAKPFTIVLVPEPSVIALGALGLGALLLRRRKA